MPTGNFEPPRGIKLDLSDIIRIRDKQQQLALKSDYRKNYPKYLLVHVSDSECGTAREIRQWHLERGFKDIGYHFVILNGCLAPNFSIDLLDGSIEVARWWDQEGAHCVGFNTQSISVCGIAKREWTSSQKSSLVMLLKTLSKQFNISNKNILGHCETTSGKEEGKTCPNLDMNVIRKMVKEEIRG